MSHKCASEQKLVDTLQKKIAKLHEELKNADTGPKRQQIQTLLHEAEVEAIKAQEKLNVCLAKK